MSVIVAMMDRKHEVTRKNVRHQGYDGQKARRNEKNVRHS
jgi:hypothetical protein